MIQSPIQPVIAPVIVREFATHHEGFVPDPGDQLLLETGEYLLLEDGSAILLE